ncbi:hypothetical protein HPA02_08250 [Bisbaumannia pacifica]|uniref:Uncharacterized protein n=1 Tax=Bisbaumannia pacifica TaxID=77098 RepID=A0A510X536_9GAMM|nr:hypothetical protein [Halomonas pacifica]GEK46542.1 hypothetical protein HPA02_08250 [Halomonas pacifica]
MLPLLAEKLPQLSIAASLAFAILVPGPRLFFQILPEWREQKRKSNTEVFDRLCEVYRQYREQPDDDAIRAQLEFSATDYCKTHVNHRLVAIAFRSDSAVQVFQDLRRATHKVIYRNGKFQVATRPHSFPTEKRVKIWSWSALSIYFLAALMVFLGFASLGMELFDPAIAVAIIILAVIPAWLSFEAAAYTRQLKRLSRIGAVIHGGSPEEQVNSGPE